MQKIITQKEKDKKNRRNQLIIGIILIGLMIFSSVGYALRGDSGSGEEVLEIKSVEFVNSDGYWRFNIQGMEFMTRYNPENVEGIRLVNELDLEDYSGKTLYFSGDYQEPLNEIGRNMDYFVERFNGACLSENCSYDYPVKNCSEDNVIVIEEVDYEGEREKIYQKDNCIFIKASLGNQTKYADAFLFDLLEV